MIERRKEGGRREGLNGLTDLEGRKEKREGGREGSSPELQSEDFFLS